MYHYEDGMAYDGAISRVVVYFKSHRAAMLPDIAFAFGFLHLEPIVDSIM